jgi:signal transduction histidine kinase
MPRKQTPRKCDWDRWSNSNDSLDAGEHHHPFGQSLEKRTTPESILEFRGSNLCQTLVPFISHDIRHHLASINCNVEFMIDPNIGQTDREHLLAEVRGTINNMTDLLDSFLRSVRTERALHLQTKSMNLLVQRAVSMVRSHPDARGCKIIICEAPPIKAQIDGQRLGTAIYNLLLNACQALKRCSQPKTVEITLRRDDSCICIGIQDNGQGVPDSIRRILVKPDVSCKQMSGIGIGLTIAEQAARAHGGCLSLKESGPGKTVFVLMLPTARLHFRSEKGFHNKAAKAHFQ